MILFRDLITTLVQDLIFSEYIVINGEAPYEGFSSSMVGVSNNDFKLLTEKLLNLKNPLLAFTLMNALNLRSVTILTRAHNLRC